MTPKYYRQRLSVLDNELAAGGIRHAEPIICVRSNDYGFLYHDIPRERNRRSQWLEGIGRKVIGEFHLFNLDLFYLPLVWQDLMDVPPPATAVKEGRLLREQYLICPEGWLWCLTPDAGRIVQRISEREQEAKRQILAGMGNGFVVQEEITHDGCWECDHLQNGSCLGEACVNFTERKEIRAS